MHAETFLLSKWGCVWHWKLKHAETFLLSKWGCVWHWRLKHAETFLLSKWGCVWHWRLMHAETFLLSKWGCVLHWRLKHAETFLLSKWGCVWHWRLKHAETFLLSKWGCVTLEVEACRAWFLDRQTDELVLIYMRYVHTNHKPSVFPWRPPGISSGNCQKTNSHGSGMSRAMTASPKLSFRAPWRVSNASISRGNAGQTMSNCGCPCTCWHCWK